MIKHFPRHLALPANRKQAPKAGTPSLLLLVLLVALAAPDGVWAQQDLVFATFSVDNVLCSNDGVGNFTCAGMPDPGFETARATSVAVADFDGVNGDDLAFNYGFPGKAERVCLNDGAGSFTCSSLPINVDATGWSIAVDFDGVNGPDLVLGGIGGGRLCLNNGSAGFSCSSINTGSGARAPAVADFDGVNGLDIAFAGDRNLSSFGGVDKVCLNDGSNNFSCSDIPGSGAKTRDVGTADFDGDGDFDLVFADRSASVGNFPSGGRLCLNNGGGAFTCNLFHPLTTPGHNFGGVAVDDFDGVNGPDVAFAASGGPFPGNPDRVCLNNGSGGFSCSDAGTPGSNSGSYSVEAVDLDGSGGPDLAFSRPDNHVVCVNVGGGVFSCSVLPDSNYIAFDVGGGNLSGASNLPPTAVCQDLNLTAGASCQASVTPAQIDDGSSDPEDGTSVALSLDTTGPFGPGPHTVTLTVEDSGGLQDMCMATVTVIDATPPNLMLTQPAAASADASCQAEVPAVEADADDNCDADPTISQDPMAGTSVGLGSHDIEVTATDASSNSAGTSTTFEVEDNTPPSITCPADASVLWTADTSPASTGSATAGDNCSVGSVSHSDAAAAGACLSQTITRTWTALDGSGNSNSCDQIIEVRGPTDAIQDLIDLVLSLGLDPGTENSLVSKLKNAKAKVQSGQTTPAVNQLGAFINEVQAQSGKEIAASDAAELIARAQAISDAIDSGGACL